jgi:hypothetical protein
MDLLPSSLPAVSRRRVFIEGLWWVPIYCANCGADGGWVTEDSVEQTGFAFYLCDEPKPCAKYGEIAGITKIPDEAFWLKVREAQLEKYGRVLTPAETVEALKDPQHMLSKLAKDRFDWKRKS